LKAIPVGIRKKNLEVDEVKFSGGQYVPGSQPEKHK